MGHGTFQVWDGTAGDRQTIHGGAGSVSVAGGNGDITYFGGTGAAVLDGSARNLAIRGGAGGITVPNAWATSTNFVGGSGDATLNIGNAGGGVTFGTGDTTVRESAWGAISYTATSRSRGTQVITGFRAGTDSLHLAGTAIAGQTRDATGTTLTTTAGARIVLRGVTAPLAAIVDRTPLLNPVLPWMAALAPQPVPAPSSAAAAPVQRAFDPAPVTDSLVAPVPVTSQLGSLQAAEPAAAQSSVPAFAVAETATGQEAQSSGDAYAGPVTFLQRQFIWSGTNGIVVSASTSDVFLHGGSGDDALAVQDGHNVLDGGAGSNFLVGGTGAGGGADTFFVDGRGGGNTWSTIVNFHHGDTLNLWGFQPGTSTVPWTADDGTAGYTGATIHSELAGAGTGVNASATFAGLTMDDVQNKLTVSTGTVAGQFYLSVAYTG